jgi:hypothetical protein
MLNQRTLDSSVDRQFLGIDTMNNYPEILSCSLCDL